MKYRIEPVDGAGFMIVEQSGPQTGEDLHRIKVLGTIAFDGEVIVTSAPDDEPVVHGRVRIGHGPPTHEVIEAEFVVEGCQP
jgi:hypothetical protein